MKRLDKVITMADAPLIDIVDVTKHFPVASGKIFSRDRGAVKAIDGVSFAISEGEAVGLVGESGCGKTTMARLVLRLEEPTSGEIRFRGKVLTALSKPQIGAYRAAVQAVFQDPQSSLSPRMRIGDIIAEPLVVAGTHTASEIKKRVAEVLEWVELDPESARLYPHEFSGGQRQRIAVARALAIEARLVVLDEPVASLDASVRSQIVNLLKDLQQRLGLSYLLISHDLATSRHLCHRIAVMYLGRMMEIAPCDDLFDDPLHPYSKALLSAALPAHPDAVREEIVLSGEIPSPIAPPSGCRFHTRCPAAMPHCSTRDPAMREVAPNRHVACHLFD